MNILIVDDCKATRATTSALVHALFPAALITEAGDALGAMAAARQGAFDVAILDVNVPGVQALEMARELHARQPQARICLASAADAEPTRELAERNGLHLLEKPLTRELLADALHALRVAA